MLRMKYYVTTLAIFMFLVFPAVSFATDNEALHFGISAILGAASETIIHHKTKVGTVERIAYGTILGSLPGLAKEVIDSNEEDNHFSGTDMAANVAVRIELGCIVFKRPLGAAHNFQLTIIYLDGGHGRLGLCYALGKNHRYGIAHKARFGVA